MKTTFKALDLFLIIASVMGLIVYSGKIFSADSFFKEAGLSPGILVAIFAVTAVYSAVRAACGILGLFGHTTICRNLAFVLLILEGIGLALSLICNKGIANSVFWFFFFLAFHSIAKKCAYNDTDFY